MKQGKTAVLIHPKDNVAVVLEDVTKAEEVKYCKKGKFRFLAVEDPIAKGHKVAIRSIPERATVVKYGLPIGVASRQIRKGQLVHIHNLISFASKGGS